MRQRDHGARRGGRRRALELDQRDDDRRRPPARRRGGLLGGGTRRREERRPRFDWDGADDGGDDERPWDDGAPHEAAAAGGHPRPRSVSLMDLCMPVFGYGAILPQHDDDPQPEYEPFRRQVVTALNRLEAEAQGHGIEAADARQAGFALCLLLDSQVAGSTWSERGRWAGEPLHIMLHQDPEAGVTFFRRLEQLGDRERAVKEVFLVVLALGFRGQYADLEATQQAARIGEIRQRLLRSIHPEPLEKQAELFPDAYRPTAGLEDDGPPLPRSVAIASLSTAGVALVLWLVLFLVAGRLPERALERVEALDAAEIAREDTR